MNAILAEATAREEVCALVDPGDAFDPASAATAGVQLRQLLWVRCAAGKKHALRVTDLLLQGGGFGVVVLDLTDITPRDARRIPLSHWFRYRRVLEHTQTCFVVVGSEELRIADCGLRIAGKMQIVDCAIPSHTDFFRGTRIQVERRKPMASAVFLSVEAVA